MHESPLVADTTEQSDEVVSKALEWQIVFLVTFIILPAVAIAIVGGYGFIVWALQIVFGPPGHVV